MESVPRKPENAKEAKIMPEVAKKLFLFSHRENNPVNFCRGEYGENLDLNNLNIKKEIINEVREKDLDDLLKVFLKAFKSYLNGPIFTDTFNTAHDYRRKWENDKEGKMSPDILEYYKNNRLNIGKIQNVIGGLDVFIGNLNESNVKDKLKVLLQKIRVRFPELSTAPGEKYIKYHSLNDQEKVEKIQQLSSIVKEIIDVVEEKPKNLTEEK